MENHTFEEINWVCFLVSSRAKLESSNSEFALNLFDTKNTKIAIFRARDDRKFFFDIVCYLP